MRDEYILSKEGEYLYLFTAFVYLPIQLIMLLPKWKPHIGIIYLIISISVVKIEYAKGKWA